MKLLSLPATASVLLANGASISISSESSPGLPALSSRPHEPVPRPSFRRRTRATQHAAVLLPDLARLRGGSDQGKAADNATDSTAPSRWNIARRFGVVNADPSPQPVPTEAVSPGQSRSEGGGGGDDDADKPDGEEGPSNYAKVHQKVLQKLREGWRKRVSSPLPRDKLTALGASALDIGQLQFESDSLVNADMTPFQEDASSSPLAPSPSPSSNTVGFSSSLLRRFFFEFHHRNGLLGQKTLIERGTLQQLWGGVKLSHTPEVTADLYHLPGLSGGVRLSSSGATHSMLDVLAVALGHSTGSRIVLVDDKSIRSVIDEAAASLKINRETITTYQAINALLEETKAPSRDPPFLVVLRDRGRSVLRSAESCKLLVNELTNRLSRVFFVLIGADDPALHPPAGAAGAEAADPSPASSASSPPPSSTSGLLASDLSAQLAPGQGQRRVNVYFSRIIPEQGAYPGGGLGGLFGMPHRFGDQQQQPQQQQQRQQGKESRRDRDGKGKREDSPSPRFSVSLGGSWDPSLPPPQAIQQMMRDFMEAKMQEQGAPTPGIDDEQHTSDEEGAGHTPMPSIPQNVPPGCIEFLGQFLGGLIGKDPQQVEKFLRDQLRQDPAIKHISIQVLPVHHRQQGGFPFGGMQPPWPQRTEEDTQTEEKEVVEDEEQKLVNSAEAKVLLDKLDNVDIRPPRDAVMKERWNRWVEADRGMHIWRCNELLLKATMELNGLTCPNLESLRPLLSKSLLDSDQTKAILSAALKTEVSKQAGGVFDSAIGFSSEGEGGGSPFKRMGAAVTQPQPIRHGPGDTSASPSSSSSQMMARLRDVSPRSLESALMEEGVVPRPGEPVVRSREEVASLASNKHEKSLVANVVSPQDIHVTYDQIGGLEEVKELLRECITYPLKYPHLYQEGIAEEAVKGVLLFGPPGTGKTMLAKAVATEGGATFLSVDASSVENMWLGESEKMAKAVFTLARKLAPCVIFLDEVDSLLSSRDRGDDTTHGTLTSLKTTLMQEWDGLRTTRDRVVVIGSTNRPFALDEAVLRRMPRRILVDLPDNKTREEILRVTLSNNRLAPDVNVTDLALQMEGYTGSDIKEVCRDGVTKISHEQARQLESHLRKEGNVPSAPASGVMGDQAIASPTELRPVTADDLKQAMKKLSASVNQSGRELERMWEWNDKYGEIKRKAMKRKPWPNHLSVYL